jgi:hypothetical protein
LGCFNKLPLSVPVPAPVASVFSAHLLPFISADLLGCFNQLDEFARATKEAAVTENYASLAKEK